MPPTNKTRQLIEFKGTTLPVVVVTLRSLHPDALAEAASALFGDDEFFDGDAALLELSQIVDVPEPDWRRVKQVLKSHGLNVIGVRGGSEELRYGAAFAGLPTYAAGERSSPPATACQATPSPLPETAGLTSVAAPPPIVTASTAAPTVFIERPLRSGQQVYARGGDLVVLAAVNAGAEVIADGNIHIYAPLRGRALAGASGDTQARIFTTCFEAELVSIAGVYRTFEHSASSELLRRPAHVRLEQYADKQVLDVAALATT